MSDQLEIPDHIRDRTENLMSTHPMTNPKVLLDTAEWWYDNGKGVNDPFFQAALAWTLATHSEHVSQTDFMEIDRAARKYAEEVGIDT